jgi:lipopolysaccharide export system protein LptA
MDQMNLLKNRTIFYRNRHKIQLMVFLCLFPVWVLAQTAQPAKPTARKNPFDVKTQPKQSYDKKVIESTTSPKNATTSPKAPVTDKKSVPVADPQKMRLSTPKTGRDPVYLERAATLSFDKDMGPDYQVVSGDVVFRHEGARLFCDSAFFYPSTNSLLAMGNAHMEQGDTLFLYAATLFYEGDTKLAKARERVRLENRDVTLFTDSLNFDRAANLGYFFDGGLLVDANEDGTSNELSSEYGQYNTKTKEAWFKNEVKLVNPKFVMTNEQLYYNTGTEIASIVSATKIVSDSGEIHTSKGWYNTRTEQSHLLNRSYVNTKNRHLVADTLDYNSNSGIGIGFGRVVLIDTLNQVILRSDYGYSDEKKAYSLMARNALLIEHSSKDTLYLHADTLMTNEDSIYRQVRAFYGVRIYRSDLQGVCDSLFYSTRDSVLRLFSDPILWSEQQQLTGKSMELFTKNNKPHTLKVDGSALVVAFSADSLYNQSSGRDLVAVFDSIGKEIVRVDINGNAETIYLPAEKNGVVTGLNRLEGSSLTMYRKDGDLEKLVVWPSPKGTFYPLEKLPPEKRYLDQFKWFEYIRPIDPLDVFRKVSILENSRR